MMRDHVRPGVSNRNDPEFCLDPSKTALLIIDVQTYLTSPPPLRHEILQDHEAAYFWNEAVPRMVGNIQALLRSFRAARDRHFTKDPTVTDAPTTGCEVFFTFLQAAIELATKDGRDISLDYKLSGPMLAGVPRVDDSDLFLASLQPDLQSGKGDILLPKTSCSVFQSTKLDYLLRNLGMEQLVIAGQLTNQCVESAVRDAADLGYFVTVCQDACAASSMKEHDIGLENMRGFSRILSSNQAMLEIAMGVESGDRKAGAESVVPKEDDQLSMESLILRYLNDNFE
jgi:ureidoacrylate peracid hydrolase